MECFAVRFAKMLFFLRGAECLGKPPLCRYCREGWIFCLRLGRRIAEWLDEARPTKDIFRFLAGGVEVVVWRVCNGNTLDFPLLAQVMLLAAAVCFAASLVCAGACFRGSKIARWYLLLVLVMIMVAVLFGNGGG